MARIIQVHAQVCVPLPPTYLRLAKVASGTTIEGNPEVAMDVADITEESLRELGAAWTEDLLEHARRRREARARETQ